MQAMTIDQWVDQPSCSTTPIWLVSGKLHFQALRLAGVPRSQIWTVRALQDFFGACGDAVKTLEEAAELFTSTAPREEQRALSA